MNSEQSRVMLAGISFPLIAVTHAGLLVGTLRAEAKDAVVELPTAKMVEEHVVGERKVSRYEHDSLPAWGYAKPQKDWFNLVSPTKPGPHAPLCVVLHSAGGNGGEALPWFSNPQDRGFYGDGTFYVLCLDCAGNHNDWWWGYEEIARNPELYKNELCPTEKRVLSTIDWVIRTFDIDRDRVYLNGISMGGSGSLGVGLNHGDVFAAVSVVVPAGVKHMQFRTASGKFPDPPPLFDISSHVDGYAAGQEDLLAYCQEHKFSLTFAWGTFGHTADVSAANPAVYEFPWLSLRRNEAYPVFTHATTDNHYPGLQNRTAPDQSGQINGYFRWHNVEDAANVLTMQLRLVRKDELRRPVEPPREASADVTLRRLQKFVASPGTVYRWSLSQPGKALQSGTITADASGTLTIPSVSITDTPANLSVAPEKRD